MKSTSKDTQPRISREEKQERREAEKQEIEKLRKQQERRRHQETIRERRFRAELSLLPEYKKKAFIEAHREEARQRTAEEQELKAQQREEYNALPPEEKKRARLEMKRRQRLEKRASQYFIPLQVLKYGLLAVLAAGLVYVGVIVYGMVFDNSAAFGNTNQALGRPSSSSTWDGQAGFTEGVDPYDLLLSQADLEFMQNRVNILVMGIDRKEDRSDWGTYRTDTMLLVSVNFETNDVAIISLPRDSYVWIYQENYRAKLNSAFSAGGGQNSNGFEYTMSTVSMLLGGIPVNNYVCFDMDVVMDVVNAMGGIDYDVEVSFELDGRSLSSGYQHLDGQQVLDYCRVRENITGGTDIARTQRQRDMIMAIFAYMKQSGQLKDIPAIYSAVASNIYTDLTFEQITSLAAFALKLDIGSLHEYLLPGGYLDMEGASFWGVDQSKKADMVYEIFGQTIQTDESADIYALKGLVEDKASAVEAANTLLNTVARYVSSNSAFISSELTSKYQALKTTLETAIKTNNPKNIEATIRPITDATKELNYWFEHTLKPAVESAAAATPTPDPSASASTAPSGSAGPSDSVSPTASSPIATPTS